MAGDEESNGLVVCGYAAAVRLENLLPKLDGHIHLIGAHTKKALLKELERTHPPVAVVEHEVPLVDPKNMVRRLLGRGFEHTVEKTHKVLGKYVLASDLLPDVLAGSPNTKLIITSHTRGFGVSPSQRERYGACPNVLKVMGFINASTNTDWILRKLSRLYFNKRRRPAKDC
jgi:hypothetical protein